MEETEFISGSKVIKQLLQNGADSAVDAIASRFSDLNASGILKNVAGEMQIVAGTNSSATFPSVTINTGIAYNANGERMDIANASVPYDSTKPNLLTPDGIGGFTNTPQSTGSANIPLATNTTQYVWIDYLATIDPFQFTLHKITNQKLFYSKQDGYQIKVGTSSSVPPVGLSSLALMIGTVATSTTSTNGIQGIDQTNKPLFGTQFYRVLAKTPKLDLSDAFLTYTLNQTVFVDDHIKAIGTGVVSGHNPHGLAPTDIGLSNPQDIELLLFSPGIVSSSIPGTASALYMQVHTSGLAAENYVEVFPLVSGEAILVNGVLILSSDIPNAVTFNFVDGTGNPLPNGVYTIYVDSVLKKLQIAAPGAFTPANGANQAVWTIQWTSPTLIANSATDVRLFGTTGAKNLRFELLGALSTGLATGNRGLTFTYDSLNNNRVTQIGIAGDNGTIAGGISLITFTYDSFSNLVQVGSILDTHNVVTTISYSALTNGLVTSITEQVI